MFGYHLGWLHVGGSSLSPAVLPSVGGRRHHPWLLGIGGCWLLCGGVPGCWGIVWGGCSGLVAMAWSLTALACLGAASGCCAPASQLVGWLMPVDACTMPVSACPAVTALLGPLLLSLITHHSLLLRFWAVAAAVAAGRQMCCLRPAEPASCRGTSCSSSHPQSSANYTC